MIRTTQIAGAPLLVAVAVLTIPALAQERPDWQYPAVNGAGPVVPVPNASAELPDGQSYKVVFNVTQGTPGDGRVSSDLASVARFVNLLALSGIDPKRADIVAVVHGPATAAVISDPYHQARFGTANPNSDLVRQLEEAGVEVVVCGQAVAGAGFPFEAVRQPVKISTSAMTELAKRQLQGYAFVPG
jgi:intracellular sulfur oxidation DsrE/DsrF family protein